MAGDCVRITPIDSEVEEEWVRDTDDDFRSVDVIKPANYKWQVYLGLANVLREGPLESEMRRDMDTALRAVPGVTDVTEGDREIWDVEGSPSGKALAEAASTVVDALAVRAHDYLGF